MIVAGVITSTMILAVFAPEAVLINMFGVALTEPLAHVIVRSWGFLIFLIGALLIYGAFKPKYRNLALVFTSISKIAFIIFIVSFGSQFVDKSLITIALDSLLVVIFITYLVKVKVLENK